MGTCEKLADPDTPLWSGVHPKNMEALGCGTIAYDEAEDRILPHVHAALGLKAHSATAHASHLLPCHGPFHGGDDCPGGNRSPDAQDPRPEAPRRTSTYVRRVNT